jgi:hypothetical protein
LKIITRDEPTTNESYIAGTIQNVQHLRKIISDECNKAQKGQTFNIDEEYSIYNTITAKFGSTTV